MLLCNGRFSKPHNLLFGATLLFVIAALMRVVYHPATEFGRAFVLGFTTTVVAAEIVFCFVYLMMRRRLASNPHSCR